MKYVMLAAVVEVFSCRGFGDKLKINGFSNEKWKRDSL
jgi:hypothetical protein